MRRLAALCPAKKIMWQNSTLTQLLTLFHTISVAFVTLLQIFMLLGHCQIMSTVSLC